DLFERGRHRASGHIDRHIYGPELAANTAGTQPRDVGHDRRLRFCDVELLEVPLRLLPQRPWIVVVAVDERRLPQQCTGAFEEGGIIQLREGSRQREADAEKHREPCEHPSSYRVTMLLLLPFPLSLVPCFALVPWPALERRLDWSDMPG